MPNVLLVDDQLVLLFTMELLLKQQGYRVFSFDDPAEVLRQLDQLSPDIAVVEMSFRNSEMTAVDIATLLGNLAPTCKMVVYTADRGAAEKEVESIVGKGVQATIWQKPMAPLDILKGLAAILQQPVIA